MSVKLLQFPPAGNRVIRARAIPLRWIGLDGCLGDNGFLRSWLEDDTRSENTKRFNWGAVSGLVLSLAISATFWAGVGVLVSRILR